MNPAVSIVALATDYDETLASGGEVSPKMLDALKRLRTSRRKLLLITGRELDDLLQVFSDVELFDCVIAENGAVFYIPAGRKTASLAPPPPQRLIQVLRQRGIQPLSVGRSIVATLHRNEDAVREAIAETGMAMEIIFNRDALMVLPAGINKGSGLEAALKELHLRREALVGVGDAENDEPFLKLCGISVAVANATPEIKELAGIVARGERGDGVIEVIESILAGTLEVLAGREACRQE
ncbi:MAG TPA: HAD family hydrolase [Candidatus Angelobacter sp.]